MDERQVALKCQNLNFKYSKNQVLKEVNFAVYRGEKIGIIGLNGSGKSTLLKVLVGLLKCQEGTIEVLGEKMTSKNLKKIHQSLGYVFQNVDEQLFMPTVEADIAFGIQGRVSEEEVKIRTKNIIDRFNIAHLSQKPPFELSGGEKRTVAIATVMVMAPEIILMDEPTEGLDARMRKKMKQFIKGSPETFIMSSHDESFVKHVCDRVIVIDQGKIVRFDKPEVIYGDLTFLKQYDLDV